MESQRSACGDAKSSQLLRTLFSSRVGNAVLATSPCGFSYTPSTHHPLGIACMPSHCHRSLRKCNMCCNDRQTACWHCYLTRRQKTAQSEGSASSTEPAALVQNISALLNIEARQNQSTYLVITTIRTCLGLATCTKLGPHVGRIPHGGSLPTFREFPFVK